MRPPVSGPTGFLVRDIDNGRAPDNSDREETIVKMSYFHRRAADSYRRARQSVRPHIDYEALLAPGNTFKAKAAQAVVKLGHLRRASLWKRETERQESYQDRRE